MNKYIKKPKTLEPKRQHKVTSFNLTQAQHDTLKAAGIDMSLLVRDLLDHWLMVNFTDLYSKNKRGDK